LYQIRIKERFSAAHQLRDYGGRCEDLHGHNWTVEVVVETRHLDHRGLALDFRVLKDKTREAIQPLDHSLLNDLPAFSKENPSSENIARYIFQRLLKLLPATGIRIARVDVWESEDACASYLGEQK
jgi:6-pyruvoyltetrahydropterin/6-carboxytetrahydropterin synthase